MKNRLVLGLEFSTQSAKAVVLDIGNGTVVHTEQVSFDDAFPRYDTQGGVLPATDPKVRHTSPAMVVEALDALLARLSQGGVRMSAVEAIKLDAQQHCTVYADETLSTRLSELDASTPLVGQVAPAFTRSSAPIWEDRSTAEQVRILEERLSQKGGLQALTGNRGELRFPAPQVLKWGQEDPASYDKTAHVLVLSAFVTSLLAGRIAPVDAGDGWGTNLNHTDVDHPGWSEHVLATIDEALGAAGAETSVTEKLGRMDHYDAPVGQIHSYFVEKYDVQRGATVLCGTGDNPATLLGCGGSLVISLGSSYTVNGVLFADGGSKNSRSDGSAPADGVGVTGSGAPEATDPTNSAEHEYNVFGYLPGSAMALSVITNGAKVHDEFRRRYRHDASWKAYTAFAGERSVTADEPLLLPYLQEESVPTKPAGIVRDGLSEADAQANIRALHISQAVSLRLHAAHVTTADAVAVVGGGSQNDTLRGFISDAFEAPTYRIRNGDFAAPLGCAVAAARYALGLSYEEAVERYVQVEAGSLIEPRGDVAHVYRVLTERYKRLEAAVNLGD